MRISLDYRKEQLCVRCEIEVLQGPHTWTVVRQWYPLYKAEEAAVKTLVGRPLTALDLDAGTYIDENGEVFELADKGATKAIEVEREPVEREQPTNGAVAPGGEAREQTRATDGRRRRGGRAGARLRARREGSTAVAWDGTHPPTPPEPAFSADEIAFAPLNLRQKLALVRRRLAYVQKRGLNERNNYSYVTAADIAGAVGDILAELGVVVVPRLESISHEPARQTNRSEAEYVTRVVMSYGFVDVDSAEEITVKTAGEGLDPGDKGPYKAMTGALKYALLQSFLLATGDDPEEERLSPTVPASNPPERRSERLITPEEARGLRQLIEETGTELERVLDYYKLTALEQMPESAYRRALELLRRKRTLQTRKEAGGHAQG